EVIFSSQMTEFLNMLRELNEQVGGTHYSLQEKPSESAHLSLGQRGDVYDLMRLPVIITFNADYATASNFLFQLRSMRRMLRIEDTKFISEIYTGNLTVLVKMDIYFVEEP
ncbi:MAG TPA: hypothetical protein PLQ76_09675, partial [bacterium]|nr:hypothetical protein [bacterium]